MLIINFFSLFLIPIFNLFHFALSVASILDDMYGATRTHLSVYWNWENGKWGEFARTLRWKGFVDVQIVFFAHLTVHILQLEKPYILCVWWWQWLFTLTTNFSFCCYSQYNCSSCSHLEFWLLFYDSNNFQHFWNQ